VFQKFRLPPVFQKFRLPPVFRCHPDIVIPLTVPRSGALPNFRFLMEFRLLTFRLFRAFRNSPFIDLPVGKSSALPAGIDLPVGISSALAAGIDLPVGTSSALPAGIDLAVGSPSALTAGIDLPIG
jgi:hypothetical protein